MDERIRPTRSGLFSIELMIAVGVFTLCAAICVGLFVRSETISRQSADLVHAVSEGKRVSECYKVSGGDLRETARLTGGILEQDALVIPYDSQWSATDADADPAFLLKLETEDGGRKATLRIQSGEESLVSWQVASLEVAE